MTWTLTFYQGNYVENFDPKQLNIGIWGGDVKLRDLRLKKESLDKLELPVDVKFGHLGLLTLQIPWASLKNKPVQVVIEDVYLLASPIVQEHYDYEEELKRELELKLRKLADFEAHNEANQLATLSDEELAKNQSFSDSLVTKIVDNLQITIKHIHLRYEDTENIFTENPYSIGVTLSEISAVSTDENWSPTFISIASSLTHKLFTLDSLCCYWNTDTESLYDSDHEVLLSKFKKSIIDRDNLEEFEKETQFILRPVSGTGNLTVNKLGTTENQPQYKTEVFFEEFRVDLDSDQYRDILNSASEYHWYNKTHKFKRFRPDVPLKGHSKEWFQYAAKAVLNEIHEKNYSWSWEHVAERRDKRKAYIKLWKEKLKLNDVSLPLKDSAQEEELNNLQKDLPYEDIKFFRSLARTELRKEKLQKSDNNSNDPSDNEKTESEKLDTATSSAASAPAANGGGWFSWWSKPAGNSANNTSGDQDDSIVLTEEQRQELYNAIEFDETRALADTLNIPRDRVKFQLAAQLQKGGFTLKNRSSRKDLAEIIFEGCSTSFLQRPDSFLADFTLQELKVEDGSEKSLYKHIVSVKPPHPNSEDYDGNDDEPFFRVSFENNPLDGSADSSLTAKLRSVTVYYHVSFINEIIKFFSLPASDHLNTILDAAEATVEGIAAQTRMGLEAIWEEHKTMNTKLDMQAPLILLPLDPTSWNSPCAIIDSGHISVISDLADKDKTNEIKNLSPEEYAKIDKNELTELMYDKYNLHLKDTQVLIGPTIKSTMEQLHNDNSDKSLLILDNLDMKLKLELSILSKDTNLPKIKTNAHLPEFIAKINDYQYKIMMQLFDSCIPDFGDDNNENLEVSNDFSKPFEISKNDKTINTEIEELEESLTVTTISDANKNQHQFDLTFNVDKVQLSLLKCIDGESMAADPLIDLIAEKFELDFFKTECDMHVDLTLETFNIEDWIEKNAPSEFKKLISSDNFTEDEQVSKKDKVFKLNYQRTQRMVPSDGKFIEVFDQDVDLDLSALKVIITRNSILTIMNFALTTFTDPNPPEMPQDVLKHNDENQLETSPQQIRVNINLDSVILVFNDDHLKIATIQLSTACFNILVLPEKMKVYSKLGGLTVHDEINDGTNRDSIFRKLLSFEGNELAEFTYETFDPNADVKLDYSASFTLKAGSLRLNLIQEPLKKILGFINQFLKMKTLYDSARDAAFNVENIQNKSSMLFNVVIDTPIIVFPKVVDFKQDVFDNITMYLGEFSASNEFVTKNGVLLNLIECGLRSTKLTSTFNTDGYTQDLKIIEDIDIVFNVDYDETGSNDRPELIVLGKMSKVQAKLTELQLNYLNNLSKVIPTIFDYEDQELLTETEAAALNANKVIAPDAVYEAPAQPSLATEEVILKNSEDLKVEFDFNVPEVSLKIFDKTAGAKDLNTCSLSKFSIENIGVKFTQKQNSHFKADIFVGAVVAEDSRMIASNKFTELIPKLPGDEHQFSATITSEGDPEKKDTLLMLHILSPKVILALDYLFALKSFFDSGLEEKSKEIVPLSNEHQEPVQPALQKQNEQTTGKFSFTVDVVNTSLILLADPSIKNSEAVVFKIEQLLVSSHNIVSMNLNNVGLFLCKINQYNDSRLRIIDDFSSSLIIDNRGSTIDKLLTEVQMSVEPLVIRVSLRDIRLAANIFNKAVDLAQKNGYIEEDTSDKDKKSDQEKEEDNFITFTKEFRHKLAKYAPSIISSVATTINRSRRASLIEPEIIIKHENFIADIEGARLVLIGSIHELPVLDMSVSPFQVTAQNWSLNLEADTSIESFVNVFNYARSSWEPLIEPWTLNMHVSKSIEPKPKLQMDFKTKKLAEVTLSSRSIALLSQVLSSISSNEEFKPRGSEKPYLIINHTGFPVNVWIDSGDNREKQTLIEDDEELPWEFEDWRKIRENLDTDNQTGVLGIEFIDSGYENVTGVLATGEGEDVYMLSPPVNGVHNRFAVDVFLREDNVKVITLKSTITIENDTQITISIKGKKKYIIEKGKARSIPIDEAFDTPLFMRPELNVPFAWSENSMFWKRLMKGPAAIRCESCEDGDDTSFYFQAEAKFDPTEALTKVYPHMKVVISAPLEIENLLPFDIQYRLYDRSEKKDWRNTLKKGNSSPVHVVKLDNLLLLSVKPLESGFGKTDFVVINANKGSEYKREYNLKTQHEDGQNLSLKIHYSTTSNNSAGVKIVIYSPYIILNRTSRDIFVKERYNVLTSKVNTDSFSMKTSVPKMFSFDEDNDRGARALIRLGNSQWSKPVSFEAIGQHNELAMTMPNKKTEVNLGIDIKEGQGKYKFSKVITIAPRYIVRNNTKNDLELLDVGSSETVHLEPDELEPLYNLPCIEKKQLKMRFVGANSKWSSPFNIADIGEIYVKLFKKDVGHVLFKVDILLEEATVFIHIEDSDNQWPYSIRNFSDYEFIFYQKDPNLDENNEPIQPVSITNPFRPIMYKIPPKSVMPYAWDYPAGAIKELVLQCEGRERLVQLAEIGTLNPMRLYKSNKIVALNVVADGPTQSLVITNYDESVSIYKQQQLSASTNSIPSTDKDGFEVVEEDSDVFTKLTFDIEGIGISLINTRLQELCYITLRGLELRFNDTDIYQTVSCKLKWIQIDNQLYGGIYPIVLYPSVVPQSSKEMTSHPAFSGSISKVKDTTHGILYIKFATILLQEMSLEIDEDFLFALLDFLKIPGASWNTELEDKLCEEIVTLPEPNKTSGDTDIYFEALNIQPTQLNLSFVRTERVNVEDKTSSQNALMFFLNILTMAIGNINDAPIKLNALFMENVRVPVPVLIQAIQTHYGQAFLYQVHKVLGSADFLGNPVGLFNNISSGVMDIFYEPYQGLIMNDRPQELGISVAKGGVSFLKKSVFGFSDSFAKVTGSIAKGLTMATLDKEFQERRRFNQRRNKPKQALYSFKTGASAFIEGLAYGLSDVAMKPYNGANEEGTVGFFKGLGKGLIGLPTKTAIGVFDLANNVSEGIRNSTTVFDNDGLDKVRLPRYISQDAVIKPYQEREAQGQYWLKSCNGGEFINDRYLAHVVLPGNELAVIVTYSHIIMLSTINLEKTFSISYDEIRSITQEKSGIKIGLINSEQGTFIPIPDQNSRRGLYRKIGEAVGEYNKHCQVVP